MSDFVFVCNANSGTPVVSVIDPASWTVTATITPGVNEPVDCAVSYDGSKLLITGQVGGGAFLYQYDAVALTFIQAMAVSPGPAQTFCYGPTISPDDKFCYISTQGAPGNDSFICKVDMSTGLLAGSFDLTTSAIGTASSTQMAVSPDGSKLYFAGGSFKVLVLDTSTMTQHTIVTTTRASNECTTLSSDGTQVYVSNTQTPGFSDVIDIATDTQVAQYVYDAGYNTTIGLTAFGGNLYVGEVTTPTSPPSTIGKFTEGTFTEVAHLVTGSFPYQMCPSSDGKFLLNTNYTDFTVSVIDVASFTLAHTIPVQHNPQGIATKPFVFVPPTPSVTIPPLFIPRKGFSPGGEYDTTDLDIDWLAVERWSQSIKNAFAAFWDIPLLFIPRKSSMRPYDLDVNWLALQNWAGVVKSIVNP